MLSLQYYFIACFFGWEIYIYIRIDDSWYDKKYISGPLEIIPQSVTKMSWYVNLITPAFWDRIIRGCITVLWLRSSWRAMQSSHVTDRDGKRYLSPAKHVVERGWRFSYGRHFLNGSMVHETYSKRGIISALCTNLRIYEYICMCVWNRWYIFK